MARHSSEASSSAHGSRHTLDDEPLTRKFLPARHSQRLASWPEVALPGPMRT